MLEESVTTACNVGQTSAVITVGQDRDNGNTLHFKSHFNPLKNYQVAYRKNVDCRYNYYSAIITCRQIVYIRDKWKWKI